jgi:cytochrome c-type biogenesis protein CcmH/NrfF
MLRIHQRLFFSLSLLALLFCLSGSVPSAKSQDSAVEPPATVTANEVKDVADELWCPLCSGVRLDACELKACEQMREVIADKLTA